LAAGFAACVKELHPDAGGQEILEIIEKSGHLYPYFDYSHGYGVPQASHLFEKDSRTDACKISAQDTGAGLQIEVGKDCMPVSGSPFRTFLYYKILDSGGKIKTYGITTLNFYTGTRLQLKDLLPGDIVRMSFNGSITEWRAEK
jgi:hypothetical protein